MSPIDPAAGRGVRSTTTTLDVVLTAVMAAVIAALGVVPPITVGVLGVPITLQTLGVMLAGALLGPVRGMLAAALVVVLALVGLPILSGGRGGLGVLFGPTGGYLLGWVPGALVVGLLARYWAARVRSTAARTVAFAVSAVVGGVLVIYAVGIPWTAVVAGVRLGVSAVGALAFVPGDLVKAVLAAVIAVGVHRGYRKLL
ncbi:biotin transport system substrate-specific component [Friedmanniella endophytica]|uniref:Biotin transporter n=1 Tax=Microlunatus kandeliicorticis TaxID=1759536 RepID=A0A7W3IRF4_9ACTN|nr:biotin transporter BioY [Microlunatus kandeliicorticis]MBA8793818.1 biotin transport system substrate-specific component [Microlunatus kandeliicorticis]